MALTLETLNRLIVLQSQTDRVLAIIDAQSKIPEADRQLTCDNLEKFNELLSSYLVAMKELVDGANTEEAVVLP
jgi:hypothetical protein